MSTRFLSCLALALLALASAPARAQSNSILNLSHYDHLTPDFAGMKREGIAAVIHEATYPPSIEDAMYASRRSAATRTGLLWGAYHFANSSDPVRQADFFLSTISRGSPPGGTLMVLDFETNTHYPGGTMTVPEAVRFIERIHERTGRYPGLYSNENRIRKVLGDPAVSSSARETLRRCWLWVANYHYEPSNLQPWSRWHMWQYTGDGICDLLRSRFPIHCGNMRNAERNLFHGSRGELADFWQANAWRPGQ